MKKPALPRWAAADTRRELSLQGLRSVVLDAVYPPDIDLYVERPPTSSER